jgi:hypothetical protein
MSIILSIVYSKINSRSSTQDDRGTYKYLILWYKISKGILKQVVKGLCGKEFFQVFNIDRENT